MYALLKSLNTVAAFKFVYHVYHADCGKKLITLFINVSS